jgi:hypothetical protein
MTYAFRKIQMEGPFLQLIWNTFSKQRPQDQHSSCLNIPHALFPPYYILINHRASINSTKLIATQDLQFPTSPLSGSGCCTIIQETLPSNSEFKATIQTPFHAFMHSKYTKPLPFLRREKINQPQIHPYYNPCNPPNTRPRFPPHNTQRRIDLFVLG